MFFSIDPAAKKALSLKKDAVFRLLVLMMILLGWLSSMAAAGFSLSGALYDAWHLNQKNHVSIYLMPDSKPQKIQTLEKALLAQKGVLAVETLNQKEVKELVAPYLGVQTSLPLPKILDVRVVQADLDLLRTSVLETFPQAEVEDGRQMLARIADGVWLVQLGALLMAVIAFLILTLLVAFTVRSGLRAQQRALNVLQYIGATEKFLTQLVLQQVWYRAFFGGGLAVCIAMVTLALLKVLLPDVGAYFTLGVWGAAFLMPALLVLVVMAAAFTGVRRTLQEPWS